MRAGRFRSKLAVGIVFVVGLFGAPLLQAQSITSRFDQDPNTSIDRAFESSPKDCADVKWSQSVLDRFPSIGDACQAVEQRNGKSYVKLEGEVEEVRDGGKRIRVDFEDGNELTFAPTPRTSLYLDGQRTEFAELEEGTELNFYIPEDRLQAELQPDPDRIAFIIVPLDLDVAVPSREQSAAQAGADRTGSMAARADRQGQLPDTASSLPLIGAAGVILLLLAGGLALVRKLGARQ